MNWINFLHFYQPAIASSETIDEVVRSCYKPWVRFLEKNSSLKITINFTACLTEKLVNSGHEDLINRISRLAEKGQIELVETLAFHSLAPLIPEKEIIKQIEINHAINSNRFGKLYNPTGFFLPEMAYSNRVAKIIKDLGYKYLILDEISLIRKNNEKINNSIEYRLKNNGMDIVFRNREISQTMVSKTIFKMAHKEDAQEQSVITATDGELYGHRYHDWWPGYSKAINNKKVNTQTISEYLKTLTQEKEICLRKSSWETSERDIKKHKPFALWKHPKNRIHKKLWQLTDFALKLNYKYEDDSNHYASRLHLENGLASCTFWWASTKDFSQVFGPHAWDPTFVEKGAQELLNSIRSLNNINSKYKLKAEKIYRQIHKLIWEQHWK